MAAVQSIVMGLQMTLAPGRLVCLFFFTLLLYDFFSKYIYLFIYLFIWRVLLCTHPHCRGQRITCPQWHVAPSKIASPKLPQTVLSPGSQWGTSALQTTTAHLRRSEHCSVGSTLSSLSMGPRDWIPVTRPQGGEHLPLLSHLLRLPYLAFSLLFFGFPPPLVS